MADTSIWSPGNPVNGRERPSPIVIEAVGLAAGSPGGVTGGVGVGEADGDNAGSNGAGADAPFEAWHGRGGCCESSAQLPLQASTWERGYVARQEGVPGPVRSQGVMRP